MLLFEARGILQGRIDHCDFKEQIPDYIEALEIAVKCIDAQMRLADIRNDLQTIPEGSTFSQGVMNEVLEECSFEWKTEEEEE